MDCIAASRPHLHWALRPPRSSHGHRRLDRYPERQRNVRIEATVYDDLDRDALHHLDEVAGRVFGRKRRELRSRTELNAIHMPAQIERRIRVDLDPDRLPRSHIAQLPLLDVRGSPTFRRPA